MGSYKYILHLFKRHFRFHLEKKNTPNAIMRRSSCPSVKRAKLQLDRDSSTSLSVSNYNSVAKVEEKEKDRENVTRLASNKTENCEPKDESAPVVKDESPRRKAPSSVDDHLMTVSELEARNADKMAELKQTLRSTQRTDHLALLRRGIDNEINDAGSDDREEEDEDDKRERLMEELRCWEEAEQELDEDLVRRGKSRGE